MKFKKFHFAEREPIHTPDAKKTDAREKAQRLAGRTNKRRAALKRAAALYSEQHAGIFGHPSPDPAAVEPTRKGWSRCQCGDCSNCKARARKRRSRANVQDRERAAACSQTSDEQLDQRMTDYFIRKGWDQPE